MATPTDAMFSSWKGRRTTSANNLQLAMDRVDSLANENPDVTIQNIEEMLCEIDVKFNSYEKAHDKICLLYTSDAADE